MHTRVCLCSLRLASLFLQSCGSLYNQIPLAFKVRFPGVSQSLCWIPRLGSLTWGSEISQQWENFFGITFLQSVGHLPGRYEVWFYRECVPPPPPSHCGFVIVFGCGVSFLVGSSVLLSMVVQQLVVILVLSQEMSACSSTPPSWTGTLLSILCLQNFFQCYYYFGEITNLAALQKNSLLSWQVFVTVVVYTEVCARCYFKCRTYYFIISFMMLCKVYIWKQ